ncbi:hypothetical protein [Herbaspirillum frisingense]|uniref:hypothetical protein n=1 Tax=Herbaspirillum frisingense TaxID=92645 RepID=UPI001F1B5A87|nr:hypothetical protein [Herbaspirillum frisingense]
MSESNTYGLPLVGRFGLAHSLLAWARCEIWCRRHAVPMLAPNWNHLRIGPYLRRERDKREYHRFFRFADYITGLHRCWLLATLPKVRAVDVSYSVEPDRSKRQLVVFENLVTGNFEQHFHEVAAHSAELLEALRKMTKPRFLPDRIIEGTHIAIHIRLGDFSVASNDASIRDGVKNTRLPVLWYAEMLGQLRSALGQNVPAVVYSDGADSDLEPVLRLTGVKRAPLQAAITDLLSIAQATAMISSGSGFSIWGCFLGQVPRICFPGQRQVHVLNSGTGVEMEPEVDFNEPIPSDFVQVVRQRLGS